MIVTSDDKISPKSYSIKKNYPWVETTFEHFKNHSQIIDHVRELKKISALFHLKVTLHVTYNRTYMKKMIYSTYISQERMTIGEFIYEPGRSCNFTVQIMNNSLWRLTMSCTLC